MPITIHRIPAKDLSTFECNGSLSPNEVVAVIDRYFQETVAPLTNNVLWGMRNASVDALTVDHAYQIASMVNGYRAEEKGIKVAVVVSKDLDFDFVKKFREKSQDALKIAKVFRKIDEAMKWLETAAG